MSRIDIVLDLETLGTKPGCVVLQIGVVSFEFGVGRAEGVFRRNIDIGSQLKAGLTIDPETVLWWRKQSDAAREGVFAPGVSLEAAVQAFAAFWDSEGCGSDSCIWVRGADFDPPIWEAAARASGPTSGWWRYSKIRDMRTALDVLGFDRDAIPREGTYHAADDDARHDLACLRAAMKWSPGVRE